MFLENISKNLLIVVFSGLIVVTNTVTFLSTAPSTDYCQQEIREALLDFKKDREEVEADRERALRPLPNLNPNRPGGLNPNESIR